MTVTLSDRACACGLAIAAPSSEGPWIEVRCLCGRRLELERADDRWVLRGDLVPEGSVPVEGFSRDLRLRPDTERFWFYGFDPAGKRRPVHVVFSPSKRVAEIKQGDVKPVRLGNVTTPTEARRLWRDRARPAGRLLRGPTPGP